MKKSYLNIFVAVSFFLSLIVAPLAVAQDLGERLGIGYAENLELPQAADEDVRDMAVSIIKYIMTFLGIIAVIIMLYGGFLWMTAAGNGDQVDKAKQVIIAGAIGLVIIIASFAIVKFVMDMGEKAINGDI